MFAHLSQKGCYLVRSLQRAVSSRFDDAVLLVDGAFGCELFAFPPKSGRKKKLTNSFTCVYNLHTQKKMVSRVCIILVYLFYLPEAEGVKRFVFA